MDSSRTIAIVFISGLVLLYGLARRSRGCLKAFEANVEKKRTEEQKRYESMSSEQRIKYQEKDLVRSGLFGCAWSLFGWFIAGPIGGAITTFAAYRHTKRRWENADAEIKQESGKIRNS